MTSRHNAISFESSEKLIQNQRKVKYKDYVKTVKKLGKIGNNVQFKMGGTVCFCYLVRKVGGGGWRRVAEVQMVAASAACGIKG